MSRTASCFGRRCVAWRSRSNSTPSTHPLICAVDAAPFHPAVVAAALADGSANLALHAPFHKYPVAAWHLPLLCKVFASRSRGPCPSEAAATGEGRNLARQAVAHELPVDLVALGLARPSLFRESFAASEIWTLGRRGNGFA